MFQLVALALTLVPVHGHVVHVLGGEWSRPPIFLFSFPTRSPLVSSYSPRFLAFYLLLCALNLYEILSFLLVFGCGRFSSTHSSPSILVSCRSYLFCCFEALSHHFLDLVFIYYGMVNSFGFSSTISMF